MKIKAIIVVPAVVLAFATLTLAASPKLISYQGRLTNASGTPVTDGNYSLTFGIWSAPSGGSLLWSETQSVAVAQSFFDVLLGSLVPIGDDVLAVGGGNPDPSDRYLQITVGSEALLPRTLLAAVPYSSVARRMRGDIFTGEGQLMVKNLGDPLDSAAVAIGVSSGGSSIRMIGGGNPEPSDLASVDLRADSNQASFFMIGGGNPDPSNFPNFGLSVKPSQSSITMVGGGTPDPSDAPVSRITTDAVLQRSSLSMVGGGTPDPSNSPQLELTTDGLLQQTSLSMIGGGSPDPGEVFLELRSAHNDSARIRMQTSATSIGIELRNSSNQVTAQLSSGALGLFVDAGSSGTAPIGTRFRDNAVVAWGKVQAGGSLISDFGVLSVMHPSSGQYTITLNNSASGLDNLIPTAIAEVSAIPTSASSARLVTVNQLSPNSFAVYITTGAYTAVDNDFIFIVTAR